LIHNTQSYISKWEKKIFSFFIYFSDMKRSFKLLFLFVLVLNNPLLAQKTQLLLLPTVHTAHRTNPKYSFANVIKIIENFKPDIIAVEIRPEDMDMDTTYLKLFYQPEMIMAKNGFPGVLKVGIDDFGKDTWGKHLPVDFRRDTTTDWGKSTRISQAMNRDTAVSNTIKRLGLPALASKRTQMLGSASAAELMDGKYDAITNEYFTKLYAYLSNTKYKGSPDFTYYRDQKLSDNIKQLALKNPGKRIIVLSGANHHNWYVINMSNVSSVELVTAVKDF